MKKPDRINFGKRKIGFKKSKSNGGSYEVIIPKDLCKLFNIQAGDEIDWNYDIKNNEIIAKVNQ